MNMRNRFVITVLALGAATFAPAAAVLVADQAQVSAPTPAGAARAWTAPRTAWGDPDLQGTWTNATMTPLERPADLAGKETLIGEELEQRNAQVAARSSTDRPTRPGETGNYNELGWERGKLVNRTSLIIDPPDGKLPSLTPEAQKRKEGGRGGRGPADSWVDRSLFERCITRGLPGAMLPGFYNHNYQILQTPGYAVILVEMIHDVRIIPLDGRPHLGAGIPQWLGDARGHWEGTTLVVETTNFNDKVDERSGTAFGTGRSQRLVERFTRVAPDTIDYQFTLDSPSTFTRPWSAAIPMTRIEEGSIYEYACHEGNYALEGILSGARADEKEKAGGAVTASPK